MLFLLVLEIHSWDNSCSRSCFENMLKKLPLVISYIRLWFDLQMYLVKRFNSMGNPFVPSSSPGLSQKCLWKMMCFMEQLCSLFLLEQAEFLFRTTPKGHGLAWGQRCWDSWNILWRNKREMLQIELTRVVLFRCFNSIYSFQCQVVIERLHLLHALLRDAGRSCYQRLLFPLVV